MILNYIYFPLTNVFIYFTCSKHFTIACIFLNDFIKFKGQHPRKNYLQGGGGVCKNFTIVIMRINFLQL